jgi:hypothetical protein
MEQDQSFIFIYLMLIIIYIHFKYSTKELQTSKLQKAKIRTTFITHHPNIFSGNKFLYSNLIKKIPFITIPL